MNRPDTGAPYASAIFIGLMVLAPLTAYLWPFGFTAFTPIASILLIPVFRPGRPDALWATLLALVAYGLISVFWSPVFSIGGPMGDYADAERQTWGKVVMSLGLYAVLVTTAARLPLATMRRLVTIFLFGTAALALVLLIEAVAGTPLYHVLTALSGDAMSPDQERRNVALGTYSLALMYWPAMAVLVRRGSRRTAGLVTIGTWSAPLLLGAWAPVAALIGGGVVYWAVRKWTGRAAAAVGWSLVATVLLAPWVVLASSGLMDWAGGQLGASWAARLDIWSFTAEQILRHPILGWGLDASRAFQPFMLHPHSAPLQVWLELGLIGAVILAGIWWLVSRRAVQVGPQGLAAVTVYFVIGGLSFGMWQDWWLGLAAMTAIWIMLSDARLSPNFDPMIEA
ncbi:MAG: O-antigen ligase family protein [Caulobacterales bacterium]|nr:O-antigen ligase family protein [Caulobacterales bacterium]